MENMQTGICSIGKSKFLDRSWSIQINASTDGTMDSSKIDGQFLIDENPDVVISSEVEDVATWGVLNVGKRGRNFGGKVEVVSKVAKVSETLSIDGKEGIAREDEEAWRSGIVEGDSGVEGNVHSICISVPAREAVEVVICGSNRFVSNQGVGNETGV